MNRKMGCRASEKPDTHKSRIQDNRRFFIQLLPTNIQNKYIYSLQNTLLLLKHVLINQCCIFAFFPELVIRKETCWPMLNRSILHIRPHIRPFLISVSSQKSKLIHCTVDIRKSYPVSGLKFKNGRIIGTFLILRQNLIT